MNAVAIPLELSERRLDELLDLWARWMRSNEPVRALGFPDTACGCVGGGYSLSFDDMVEAMEGRAAEAMNAAIDSLPPVEQAAVLNVHLYAVFRFREAVEEAYGRARQSLRLAMPARGFY